MRRSVAPSVVAAAAGKPRSKHPQEVPASSAIPPAPAGQQTLKRSREVPPMGLLKQKSAGLTTKMNPMELKRHRESQRSSQPQPDPPCAALPESEWSLGGAAGRKERQPKRSSTTPHPGTKLDQFQQYEPSKGGVATATTFKQPAAKSIPLGGSKLARSGTAPSTGGGGLAASRQESLASAGGKGALKVKENAATLPLDFAIRTRIRLEGIPGTINALLEPKIPASDEAEAIRRFARGESCVGSYDHVGWMSACMYWAHPGTSLPPLALRAQPKALDTIAHNPSGAVRPYAAHGAIDGGPLDGWSNFFWARRRDWEEAFRSLHIQLREEGTNFYLRYPQFSVVWCKDGDDLVAIVTKSTRLLRQRMQSVGIDFTMPLDPQAEKRDALVADDVNMREALKEFGAVGSKYSLPEEERRHQTLLVIRGSMPVKLLFDYFLEVGAGMINGVNYGIGRSQDVPLLLSAKPFLGGTLRQLQTRFRGRLKRPEGKDDVDVLELAGPVLPSQLRMIAQNAAALCAHASQGGRGSQQSASIFRMTTRIDQDTMHVNRVLQEGVGDGYLSELTPTVHGEKQITYTYGIRACEEL
jgi:hypothetical protein